jgi:MFS family permease
VLSFRLAFLTYLFVAFPGATLGMLWPSVRLDLHAPVGALGVLLIVGTAASGVSSVLTEQLMTRLPASLFVTSGTALVAGALALEALTWSLWVFAGGCLLFGIGFGAVNAALTTHAAHHFGPRDITWSHAGYGLGAMVGPLVVTAVLSNGLSWRDAFWIFALTQGAVACVLAVAVRTRPREAVTTRKHAGPAPSVIIGTLAIVTVETGVESGAGVWGYLFLTEGWGLGPEAAGLAVSAYWATMFVGRALLGPLAQRVGARVVLGWSIGGVAAGTGLMVVPGSGLGAVAAMVVVGLAAAPIFPLLALTTGTHNEHATRVVGWQTAASSVGGASLPAGMGLAIDAFGVAVLAPLMFGLSAAMCVVYVFVRGANGLS